MQANNNIPEKYWAGGFLYNPKTKEVFLHKRDANTAYNPNKWAFFGGLNEGAETPRECYARELLEETGLKVEDSNTIHLCEYMNEEFSTYRIVFYSESDVAVNDLHLGEGSGFGWISLDSLNEYDLTAKTVKDLKFFMKTIASPYKKL